MRIVDALKNREMARQLLDPNDHALIVGTVEEREAAWRERQRHQRIRGIVSSGKTEIPRSELEFGRRWITHEPTGAFYRVWDGDPQFAGADVPAYFVNETGDPILLERATNPGSRADLEDMRAAKQERRAAREAEIAQRRAQRLAEAKAAPRAVILTTKR